MPKALQHRASMIARRDGVVAIVFGRLQERQGGVQVQVEGRDAEIGD
jgi:hypothetical protein